jgi:hypothetical protein
VLSGGAWCRITTLPAFLHSAVKVARVLALRRKPQFTRHWDMNIPRHDSARLEMPVSLFRKS